MRRSGSVDWLLSISIAAALGFNYVVIPTAPPIYVSHLFLPMTLVLIGLTALSGKGKLRIALPSQSKSVLVSRAVHITAVEARTILMTARRDNGRSNSKFDIKIRQLWVILALFAFALVGIRNESDRFVTDFGKFAYLLLAFYAFSVLLSNNRFNLHQIVLVFGVAIVISAITMGDYQGAGLVILQNKPDITGLGGANSYGFIIGLGIVQLLALFRLNKSVIMRSLLVAGMVLLFSVELTTVSRGGLVTLVAGVLVFLLYARLRKKDQNFARKTIRSKSFLKITTTVFIFVLGVMVLVVYPDAVAGFLSNIQHDWLLVFSRFDDSTGTSRIDVWRLLLTDLWNSGWLSILLGRGLGSIYLNEVTNFSGLAAISAHNTYVEILYEFGVLGFVGLVAFLLACCRRLMRLSDSVEKVLLLAMFVQFVISMLYDSYFFASQIGWLFGFWFAVFWSFSGESYQYRSNLPDHSKPLT